MHFTAVVLTALLGLTSAQKVTVVSVSNSSNALIFSPNNIKVGAGEMVQFQFLAGNHTVTQSTFDQPCQPISQHSNATGFHSGFIPVAASASSGMTPTYTIMVNDTKPLWIYCAQGKHCEAGMVMVINENTAANSSRSLANFEALAAKASTSVPGSSTSGGSTGTTSGTSGTSASGSASNTPAAGSAATIVKASSTLGLLGVAVAFLLL